MKRNLRRLEATEADTLRTITDFLDLQQAQGKLLYLRHSPSNVIISWKLIKKILWDLFHQRVGVVTAFQKIKSSCFRKLPESQLGAPDLFVFKKRLAFGKVATPITTQPYEVLNVLCVEVKSATGKQSAYQKKWQQRAEARGMKYIIARSLEDVVKELR